MFPGHHISCSGDFAWSSGCSNPTAPDFFLWGYLKYKVYINQPRTIMQVKDYTGGKVKATNATLLRTFTENFQSRLQKCNTCHEEHIKKCYF
jgi:hypothetical protein